MATSDKDEVQPSLTTAIEGWPEWIDRKRYTILGWVILLLFAVYGWLVYTSGSRPLSAVEQVAMALIGIFVSAIVGFVVSLPFAKRRINIASQLRRAYGIKKALVALTYKIRGSTARMSLQENLATRALLWEEIADWSVGALDAQIAEAERIIEDWSEVDPAERRRIQEIEDDVRERIEGLQRDLETAQSVEKDLEGVTDLAPLVRQIRSTIEDLLGAPLSSDRAPRGGLARGLADMGYYEEAVKAYDEIIRQHPSVHTNYIGRARARHLAGDRTGALADLDRAENMHAEDAAISRLREQILSGASPTEPLGRTASSEQYDGNTALSRGLGEEALEHYEKAESLGWHRSYSTFNRAMAMCLLENAPEARALLESLDTREESHTDINVTALKLICAVVTCDEDEELRRSLQNKLDNTDFDYQRSPLRFLEAGIRSRQSATFERALPVFDLLAEERPFQGSAT